YIIFCLAQYKIITFSRRNPSHNCCILTEYGGYGARQGLTIMLIALARMTSPICWSWCHMRKLGKPFHVIAPPFPVLKTARLAGALRESHRASLLSVGVGLGSQHLMSARARENGDDNRCCTAAGTRWQTPLCLQMARRRLRTAQDESP